LKAEAFDLLEKAEAADQRMGRTGCRSRTSWPAVRRGWRSWPEHGEDRGTYRRSRHVPANRVVESRIMPVTGGGFEQCYNAQTTGREPHYPSLAQAPEAAKNPTPVRAMAHRLKTAEGKTLYALRKLGPGTGVRHHQIGAGLPAVPSGERVRQAASHARHTEAWYRGLSQSPFRATRGLSAALLSRDRS
jgi:hypothetical protein